MALFPVYEQNKYHEAGEVALHPDMRYLKECMTAMTARYSRGVDDRYCNLVETVALPESGIRSAVGTADQSARYVQDGRVHDLDGWKHKEMYSGH